MGGSTICHGIDIVDIERIAQAVSRWGDRFLRRVFTDGEMSDSNGRASSLAARFAAKEAAAKALGVGLRGLGAPSSMSTTGVAWRDIEVVRAPSGQPILRLSGRAAERAAELGWEAVSLSLSHTHHVAVASVVALAAPSPMHPPARSETATMVE
ncbi:MAG: holo-ACP synthase [Chloroflexota bacterium]|nr:holo-ACP synthase [Chloroflexota bacterium]